jgi:diguanylate cyclase (GGDEF)-like protein
MPELNMPTRFSRAQAWIVVLLGTGLTVFFDIVTGPEIWLGPLYLLCIALSAWTIGWREAVGLGFACLAITGSANGFNLYPHGTASALWNLAMRAGAVLMFIGLLNFARNSYYREWRLARTDALTGALNRKAFFELINTSSLSRGWQMLAYADLDGLKKLNDQFGHAAGDQFLKSYVAHVRTAIRKQDIFARIGGDEFLVLMRVRNEAAAMAMATRLHTTMNTIMKPGHPHVRCSIGVLILPPSSRMIDRDLGIADALMYESKQRGAGLTVATAHDHRGTLSILRHAELGGGHPVTSTPRRVVFANDDVSAETGLDVSLRGLT